jgi:putative ABC transport system permease protein
MMLGYYFLLGIRNLRRSPALTALMVVTLAIGVAASVSTLTILQVMSADPIPHKSGGLVVPVIDNGLLENYKPDSGTDDQQMSYPDAINLLAEQQGIRRTAVFGISGGIEPVRADLPVVEVSGLAITADYFTMFETPFQYGTGWREDDDSRAANVIVLSRLQSETLFGQRNPVGERVRFLDQEFQIIGVRDTWNQLPRYTHLINGNGGSFNGEDHVYIPFSTAVRLEASPNGNLSCSQGHGPGFQGLLASECTWIQFWFEVKGLGDRAVLNSYLGAYASAQRKLGRLPRPDPIRLYNVTEWLDHLNVVRSDSKLAVWLAFGFLSLCLVNTIGLLLAKFSVRRSEVGVRRALGANRREIFKQFLIETGVVGLSGAVLGLPLSFFALQMIAKSSAGFSVAPPLNWFMLCTTFVLSIAASLLAGLLPTWRACQVTPAIQLKSQ